MGDKNNFVHFDYRDLKGKSHSMEALETPEPSLKSFDANICDQNSTGDETISGRRRHRSKPHTSLSKNATKENRRSLHEQNAARVGQNGCHTSNGINTQRKPALQNQKPNGIENIKPEMSKDEVILISSHLIGI